VIVIRQMADDDYDVSLPFVEFLFDASALEMPRHL
jgi:hypothetical protein